MFNSFLLLLFQHFLWHVNFIQITWIPLFTRNELYSALQKDRESVKNDIISEIKNDIISEIQVELNAINDEITEYKKFETDPNNYFTIGSTMDEVKSIMGSPTSIQKLLNEIWFYDVSYITFKNGKVSEYSNNGELRVK